jgi:hypothetical protein
MLSGTELAYWPNIQHLVTAMRCNNFEFKNGIFQKQKFKNRCEILSANGKQVLTIPIHAQRGISDRAIRICNRTRWQHTHLRALDSAYNNSPFYWHYKSEIYELYESTLDDLFSFNTLLFSWLLTTLNLQDHNIHSEMHVQDDAHSNTFEMLYDPYLQVFANKFNFIPNLSTLDVLFNKGPESSRYLKTLAVKRLT